MRPLLAVALVACSSPAATPDAGVDASADQRAIHRVFLILMENKNWAAPAPDPVIVGNPSAPYLNSLLADAAYAENYWNPPALHPSALNYVWLEAGDTMGIGNDHDPTPETSIASTEHLVNLLEDAGLDWRAYVEGIDGTGCPVESQGHYVARHVPFVYFRDVTSTSRCVEHIRPFDELAGDLAADRVADYVFITPDLCHDMHGAAGCEPDGVKNGDRWLADTVPEILASDAYQRGDAVVLITWDESIHGDHPIGMLALSPHARAGHAVTRRLDHSSTLRTLQELFGVDDRLLGHAADATSLAELFDDYP